MQLKIGEIGVDAGLCWIGDPCYILHTENPYDDIGKNWRDFVNRLYDKGSEQYYQFNYDGGSAGLGVCVRTGYGDGVYPVYAEIVDGVVKRAWVEFVSDEKDEE